MASSKILAPALGLISLSCAVAISAYADGNNGFVPVENPGFSIDFGGVGGDAGSGTIGGDAGTGTIGGDAGSGTIGGAAGSGTIGGAAGSGTIGGVGTTDGVIGNAEGDIHCVDYYRADLLRSVPLYPLPPENEAGLALPGGVNLYNKFNYRLTIGNSIASQTDGQEHTYDIQHKHLDFASDGTARRIRLQGGLHNYQALEVVPMGLTTFERPAFKLKVVIGHNNYKWVGVDCNLRVIVVNNEDEALIFEHENFRNRSEAARLVTRQVDYGSARHLTYRRQFVTSGDDNATNLGVFLSSHAAHDDADHGQDWQFTRNYDEEVDPNAPLADPVSSRSVNRGRGGVPHTEGKIFVNVNAADSGFAANGNFESPFTNLEDAVNHFIDDHIPQNSGQQPHTDTEIWVAPGIYELSEALELPEWIVIKGGWDPNTHDSNGFEFVGENIHDEEDYAETCADLMDSNDIGSAAEQCTIIRRRAVNDNADRELFAVTVKITDNSHDFARGDRLLAGALKTLVIEGPVARNGDDSAETRDSLIDEPGNVGTGGTSVALFIDTDIFESEAVLAIAGSVIKGGVGGQGGKGSSGARGPDAGYSAVQGMWDAGVNDKKDPNINKFRGFGFNYVPWPGKGAQNTIHADLSKGGNGAIGQPFNCGDARVWWDNPPEPGVCAPYSIPNGFKGWRLKTTKGEYQNDIEYGGINYKSRRGSKGYKDNQAVTDTHSQPDNCDPADHNWRDGRMKNRPVKAPNGAQAVADVYRVDGNRGRVKESGYKGFAEHFKLHFDPDGGVRFGGIQHLTSGDSGSGGAGGNAGCNFRFEHHSERRDALNKTVDQLKAIAGDAWDICGGSGGGGGAGGIGGYQGFTGGTSVAIKLGGSNPGKVSLSGKVFLIYGKGGKGGEGGVGGHGGKGADGLYCRKHNENITQSYRGQHGGDGSGAAGGEGGLGGLSLGIVSCKDKGILTIEGSPNHTVEAKGDPLVNMGEFGDGGRGGNTGVTGAASPDGITRDKSYIHDVRSSAEQGYDFLYHRNLTCDP